MPRMVDLVRKPQLSSNMMQAAARGALMVAPAEMLEILVHLALHNKVFGEQARMTLAGWDEKASKQVAADPATHKEVLEYLVSPKNIRPALIPSLLENSAVSEEKLAELASTGSRAVIEAMLPAGRVKESPALQEALRSNPRLRQNELNEAAAQDAPAAVALPEPPATTIPVAPIATAVQEAPTPVNVVAAQLNSEPATVPQPDSGTHDDSDSVPEHALAEALEKYLQENAAELNAQENKPFQPIGGAHGDEAAELAAVQNAGATPAAGSSEAAKGAVAAAPAHASTVTKHAKKPGTQHEERRDSTLQKIAKLDIKGRIALAVRGGKEERSILIRDGTKLVALAVLDSPKITDGEVEGFALQKNVLEAVLRAIPLKRRFAKSYAIMRNLVYNPRTPLDLSLGLMKNLLIHDLKNLSGNKEVSETIRKLALRMYKQKMEKKD